MNVLLLGGGGREHALAWKLRSSPLLRGLWALPGSAALAKLAHCLPGSASDAATVTAAAAEHACDLVVVGPEAPLAAGVSDALRAAGRLVFGPSRGAAELETSKIFAKRFMRRHAIPTARFFAVDDLSAARHALAILGVPVVLKADGLAAGKGVVVAADEREALAALEAMLAGTLVGEAGRRLVIEEFLAGPELSLLALCDGERFVLLPPARDHKRLGEGDRGPNTGGMGAVSCDSLLSGELRRHIAASVLAPTLAGMAREGRPFQGVLYCGLMLTADGPRVLEYNVRFGDPETQALMLRLDADLLPWLHGCAQGRLPEGALTWPHDASACVVAASAGYPGPSRIGDPITGLDRAAAESVTVFHSGTEFHDGAWRTAGGRVLAVAARAPNLPAALAACYRGLAAIHFPGMQFRRDIGGAIPTPRSSQ